MIQADEFNELAWMWMAAVAENNAQRREALEIVLEINPDNARAREALDRLGGPRARQLAEQAQELAERVGGQAPDETAFQRVVERPPQPEEPAPPPPDPAQAEAERLRRLVELARQEQAAPPDERAGLVETYDLRGEQWQRLLRAIPSALGSLLFVVAGAALVALLIWGALWATAPVPPTATPTLQLETALALLATHTPTPEAVLIVTRPSAAQALLPPTWTPLPTPRPSATPLLSPTPPPPGSYSLVFSRRAPGGADYDLYAARGDGSGLERLVSGPGDDRDPALSPDGQRMVYVTEVDGARELVLLRMAAPPATPTAAAEAATEAPAVGAASGAQVLTRLGGSRTSSPSWSPDGARVVFSSDFDGDEEIYIISVDGESLAKLTDNEGIVDRDPAWSPDGETIVFASDRDGPGRTELYSVRPNGTGVTRLTDAAGSSYQPAWSPDGETIVFVSDRDRDADLYLMDANGSNERLLTRNDDAEDRDPAWSADGRWIVFGSNRESRNFRLYAIDPLSGQVLPVTRGEADDIEPRWLPEAPRP